MKKIIAEGKMKFYQDLPRGAAIITAHARGKDNAMAAAWHAPISFNPPLFGVAIHHKRFTYELIRDAREFGVNFLPLERAELIASVGGSTGRKIDKFQTFHIAKEKPLKTSVPIMEDAYACYECKLTDDRAYGDHQWLVGEVLATHFSKEAFTEEGALDVARTNPALYLGNDLYLTTSKDTIHYFDRGVYGKLREGNHG
jgi:flavin reductase (DIM6/NTAB) family NADH-FMN oxidoreductase RutF